MFRCPCNIVITESPGSAARFPAREFADFKAVQAGPSCGEAQVRFIEQGTECDPKLCKHRARSLARALRKLGYIVQITPINSSVA